nr:putative retrotransposon Gag domain-containing protein [Tanacetum cinerariifolium]
MANPNLENLNVPNEGVPEEDPHHLLDYDKEEDPKMDIEEEESEEDSIEEPEPLAGHGDQFDAHPNPQPGNMNGWVDDDDDVEEEDEENEDADMEEDDDAEIIFPYEVQGDQTLPPKDESSDFDSEPEAEEADDEPVAEDADDKLVVEEAGVEPEAEGADVELEAKEPDGVLEATSRTGSYMPFAVCDFPMGFHETGESSTAHEPQFVGGLAPWALRHDLEALPRHERIREAESETSRTEVALVMPPKPMSEARMREIIRDQFATSLNEFMANMNSGAGGSGGDSGSGGAGGTGGNADETGVRGARPTVPELTGTKAIGIEAANNTPWSEVKKWMTEEFCPRSVIQRMEQELYNLRMKGMDIDGYTNRFHELALLCLR